MEKEFTTLSPVWVVTECRYRKEEKDLLQVEKQKWQLSFLRLFQE